MLVCREAVPGAQDLHLLLARHGVRDHRAFASKVLGREVTAWTLMPGRRYKSRQAAEAALERMHQAAPSSHARRPVRAFLGR